MTEDIDPPSTVPLEHEAAIGSLARTMGHLEHMIDLLLWELVGAEQQFVACVTAQMPSMHPKMNAIAALVMLRGGSPKLRKAVDVFKGRLHSLTDERNRAVHDARFKNARTGEIVRWQATATAKDVVFGMQPETVEQLRKTTADIRRQIKAFAILRRSVQNDLLVEGRRPLVVLHRAIDGE